MIQHRLVADLHLHSRFSMATSPQLNLQSLALTGVRKGIDLLAAPDFTHPTWREEMRAALEPDGDGIFRHKEWNEIAGQYGDTGTASDQLSPGTPRTAAVDSRSSANAGPAFILTSEISCIWYHGGKSRRVHVLLMAPSFEAVDRISETLSQFQDLLSDGRPMIKLSVEDLYSAALEADERCVLFPAHAWTPWYGVYGSKSGFDSLEECFGEHTERVPAIETGLSSDPAMNWAVSDIGDRAIVSFSDAHSAGTMGRELTVLDAEPEYESVRSALFENRVIETVEFHPEHGKYHLNGHRKCGVKLTPEQTPQDGRCTVCGRPLTLGVLQRVSELSDLAVSDPVLKNGLMHGDTPNARPFRQLVPLKELVAHSLSVGPNTKKVAGMVNKLIDTVGSELAVLTTADREAIAETAGDRIADAIVAVRNGDVDVNAGFDGVYGTVSPVI